MESHVEGTTAFRVHNQWKPARLAGEVYVDVMVP